MEEGKLYTENITGINDFGVLMEILLVYKEASTTFLEGLYHIKKIHTKRVSNCNGFVKDKKINTIKVK